MAAPAPPLSPESVQLIQGVSYRQLDLVKDALDHGANVNAVTTTSNSGNTALHIITQIGLPDDNAKLVPIIKLLLSRGANLNIQNRDGTTALMFATTSKNIETMKLLLDAGADVTLRHNSGQTALNMARDVQFADGVTLLEHRAAAPPVAAVSSVANPEENKKLTNAVRMVDKDAVVAALAAGADVNSSVGFFQVTPLHWAMHVSTNVQPKMVEIIKILLEKGADVNLKTSDGVTAFMQSLHSPMFFYMLLQKHPDLTIQTNAGKTVLDIAKGPPRREQVIDVLNVAGHGDWDGAIRIASANAEMAASLPAAVAQAVESVVASVVAPVPNPEADKQLLVAAAVRDIDRVTKALNDGANVNAVSPDRGMTALHAITTLGRPSDNANVLPIVKLLLSRGANPNIQNKDGMTPLMYATASTNIEVMKLLLNAGADVAITQNGRRTAISIANEFMFTEGLRLLQERQGTASPPAAVAPVVVPETPPARVSESERNRALEAAVTADDDAAAQAAILAGANPNMMLHGDRETAFIHYAAANNRPMVEFMLAHQADVNGRAGPGADQPGWTALDYTRNMDIGEFIEERGGMTARLLDYGPVAVSQLHFASDYAEPRLRGREDLDIQPITLVEDYVSGADEGVRMETIDVKDVFVANLGRDLGLDQFFRKYMGDGIVFKVGPKFYGIPRKDLIQEYMEGSAIAYECTDTFRMDDPDTRGTFEYSDIYSKPFFSLRTPAGVLYIPLSTMKGILGVSHGFYKIEDKPIKKLENIASRSSVLAGGPVSSQLHCQAGSDGNVYAVAPFKLPEIEEDEESDEEDEPNVVYVKKGEDKTEFPLDLSQTVLQLKEAVKEKLGIAVETQKMVFQGKVLKDDQTLGEAKVGKGYVIQLQVSGGRKTFRNKKKHRKTRKNRK
jgi:ankyrin repeat protein